MSPVFLRCSVFGRSAYLALYFPALTTYTQPYLIAEEQTRIALAESAREHDVLLLGGDTPRRRQAEKLVLAHPATAGRAEFIWSGLWGSQRDAWRARFSPAVWRGAMLAMVESLV